MRFSAIIATQLLAFASLSQVAAEPDMTPIFHFDGRPEEPRWVAINDGVMGGRSRGGPEFVDGHLRFAGVLSLENNGGFSSIRTVGQDYDFSDAQALTLRVRGDGRTYQVRLATDASYRDIRVSYGSAFETVADEWINVRLPWSTFKPSVRGMALSGPPMDRSQIREIGILIGDKREGPFQLDVDTIALAAVN